MRNLMKKVLVGLSDGVLGVNIFSSQCLAGVDLIISGKYKLPTVGCSGNPNDWVSISFPKAFSSIPTVIVTHELPSVSGNPYPDSFLSVSEITKTGFKVQRRNLANNICNEIATVNYMAVGN